jgi:hypothetical protein
MQQPRVSKHGHFFPARLSDISIGEVVKRAAEHIGQNPRNVRYFRWAEPLRHELMNCLRAWLIGVSTQGHGRYGPARAGKIRVTWAAARG